MKRFFLFIIYCTFFTSISAQQAVLKNSITILNENAAPVAHTTVIISGRDKPAVTKFSNEKGIVSWDTIAAGTYTITVSNTGYKTQSITIVLPLTNPNIIITLQKAVATLQEVSVTSKKPMLQYKEGKTIVNVDAAVTNTGTTVLEVLEKSPGVMVDKNGGISMQGKAGVLVMIDDKPTYLSGADLNNLLSSMSSTQVETIELMPNPPAKYDAAGNAGIINIKTKKNKVKGFNGSATVAASQGVYPKHNNSVIINYRSGKYNTYLTYSTNINKYLTDIYALRKYYNTGGTITAVLDQPTYFTGLSVNSTLKAGIDYTLNTKTTLGLVLGGTTVHRNGSSDAAATWLNAIGAVDSSVVTTSSSNNTFKNGSVNANLRHSINKRTWLLTLMRCNIHSPVTSSLIITCR